MQCEFVNSTAIIKNEPRRDPNSPNAQPWLDEQMMKSKYGVTRYIYTATVSPTFTKALHLLSSPFTCKEHSKI
jgi:hypothetical protein